MGSIVGGRRNLKADATINQNNNCLLTAFTFRSSVVGEKYPEISLLYFVLRLVLNLIFSSCLLNQLWVDVCVHEGIVIDYWEPDLDQHHVRGEAESQVSWFSRMLNQLWSRGDKIPLSSSLKGKELALNWGRQNINHTQRLLLSIHHTSKHCYKNWKNYRKMGVHLPPFFR